MINIKMWKDSPGADASGFKEVKAFLKKKGATQQDSWEGDLYADADYSVTGSKSLEELAKELKEMFPSLADVDYSTGAQDGQFDQAASTWGQGGVLNITYNKRVPKKEIKDTKIPEQKVDDIKVEKNGATN